MNVIGHKEKQSDVPAVARFVEPGGMKDRRRESGARQARLMSFAIQSDADVKERTNWDPGRDFVVQSGGETTGRHQICEAG